MKKSDIDIFERLQGQLQSFHQELVVLVKKSPNDALNKFKLSLINALLDNANEFLLENRPFNDFTCFDETSMPSNSDVLLIVSQYLSAFEKVRADNIHRSRGYWAWEVEDGDYNDTRYQVAPPRKINP